MSQIFKPSSGGGPGGDITLVDDSSNTLVGTNFPILGASFNSAKVMETQVSGLNFLIANNTWDTAYVVDQNTAYGEKGTFSTIQDAVDAIVLDGVATSSLAGLIKIRPGVYTETTITIPTGVIIVLAGDVPAAVANTVFGNDVRISGTIVLTDPTTLYIYNLRASIIDPVPASSSLFAVNCWINNLTLLGTANLENCWGSSILSSDAATLNCSFCVNLNINLAGGFVTIENCNDVTVDQNTAFSQLFINETTNLNLTGTADPSSVAFVQNALVNNPITLTGGRLLCGSLIEGQGGFTNFFSPGVESDQLRMTKGNCYNSRIIDDDFVITAYDYFVGVKGNSAAVAITLSVAPLAVADTQTWRIADLEGTAENNPITITPSAGLINGAASYVINSNYGSIEIYTDGTDFFVLGNNVAAAGSPTIYSSSVDLLATGATQIANFSSGSSSAFIITSITAVGTTITGVFGGGVADFGTNGPTYDNYVIAFSNFAPVQGQYVLTSAPGLIQIPTNTPFFINVTAADPTATADTQTIYIQGFYI